MGRFKPLIVIPAFNEGSTISAVLQRLSLSYEVVVVDDGSTDETALIAKNNGAHVISHEDNMGYSAAIDSGFSFAVVENFTHVITCDADGELNPSAVSEALALLRKNPHSLIIGNRINRSRFSEHLAGFVCKKIWRVDDIFCGLKAYEVDLWRSQKKFETYDSCGTQLFLNGLRDGKNCLQIEVDGTARVGKARFDGCIKAHVRILKQIYYFISAKC